MRTRPHDQQRVLVTETQAEEIEEQWSIANGTHKEYLARKQRFTDAKKRLAKGGMEPSHNLVRYHLLNQEAMEHAKLLQMGLYRSAVLGMAEALRKEGQLEDALSKYLQVCYVDLNGPSNTGTLVDRRGRRTSLAGKDNPPWDPKKWGKFVPVILGRTERLIGKAGLDRIRTREAFMHGADAVQEFGPPISPGIAWGEIERELIKAKSLTNW